MTLPKVPCLSEFSLSKFSPRLVLKDGTWGFAERPVPVLVDPVVLLPRMLSCPDGLRDGLVLVNILLLGFFTILKDIAVTLAPAKI